MKPITITQLNRYVSSILASDSNLSDISVLGEISSLRKYSSGHYYFTLKDEQATVSCVMFKSWVSKLSFDPHDGLSVVAKGKASIYEKDGKYQLYIQEMLPDGIGDLHAAFEKLKEQLLTEGLFDIKHKKPIPYLPRRIGVITSPSGAVIRDIIHVLRRRFPNFDLVLYPVLVQGELAAVQIADAIKTMNDLANTDVLIVGRGGGSLEDLWCFNEEIVARAVYASVIPIVSAVGHETDFTICDFAADLRAPTPSAAAELIVPVKSDLQREISHRKNRLIALLENQVKYNRIRLEHAVNSRVFLRPDVMFDKKKQDLVSLEGQITDQFSESMRNCKEALRNSMMKIDHFNPMKVLARGYALPFQTEGETTRPVHSVEQLSPGDPLSVRMSDGITDCTIIKIRKGVNEHDQ